VWSGNRAVSVRRLGTHDKAPAKCRGFLFWDAAGPADVADAGPGRSYWQGDTPQKRWKASFVPSLDPI